MHPLILSLESSLLAPLLEFALSPSGHVEPRRGLALGWLGSVVAGLAVVFGTADRAQADYCGGLAVGACGTIGTGQPCTPGECVAPYTGELYVYACNYTSGCVAYGDPVCYC